MAPTALAAPETAAPPPNAATEINRRAQAKRFGWAGPLTLLFGRSALAVLAQALVAAVFWLQGQAAPWRASAAWWTVWGTLVDLGCLAALLWFVRREGLRLTDLFSFDRRRLGRDALLGLGVFLVLFPLCIIGGTLLSSWVVFGTLEPPLFTGQLTGRVLPLWGALYSVLFWWVVWSPTEELTYNGYVLPRLAALSGSRWLAVGLVALLWALQHAALPVIFDARYLLWKTLSFLPLALAMALLYLRTRRLMPLVFAHMAMDVLGAVYTLAW